MKLKGIFAFLNLAFHFWIRIAKRLLFIKSPGLKEFLSFYQGDRIVGFSKEEKKLLIDFSQCVNCSLCDASCPAMLELPRHQFPGPSMLVKSYSRSAIDYPYVPLIQDYCGSCQSCESVCPERIPIKQVFHLIKKKQEEQTGKLTPALWEG
jgi:succinate dehydrogenase/fumarate reductase-like Fe-S protein